MADRKAPDIRKAALKPEMQSQPPSPGYKSNLDNTILAARPNGLVKLQLTRTDQHPPVDYYATYPIRLGPQPLLGVHKHDLKVTYPDSAGFIPKALKRELRLLAAGSSLVLPLSKLTFCDFLTVLPTKFPYSSRVERDPVFLTAMSLLTISYQDYEIQSRADGPLMRSVPSSTKEPPFRLRGDTRLVQQISDVLKSVDEEDPFSPPVGGLRSHAIRLGRWQLWNLQQDVAIKWPGWAKHWKVLQHWHRWMDLGMSFPECAYDQAASAGHLRGRLPHDFTADGETLRKFSGRIGLTK